MVIEAKQISTTQNETRSVFSDSPSGVIASLTELRQDNPALYREIINTISFDDHSIFDELIGRAPVKISDGFINYKYRSFFGETKGQIIDGKRISNARTLANNLIDLLNQIEESSPDDIIECIASNMQQYELRCLITSLRVCGDKDSRINRFLRCIRNPDEIVLESIQCQERWLDCEFYPMDRQIQDTAKDILSSYIETMLPKLSVKNTNVKDDEHFIDVVRIAFVHSDFLNKETLKHIVMNSPFPESLSSLHLEGSIEGYRHVLENIPFALRMIDFENRFSCLSPEELLEYGQNYLDFMSQCYGIFPPANLSYDNDIKGIGAHKIWRSPEVSEHAGSVYASVRITNEIIDDNLRHPLGRVLIKKDYGWRDTSEFLETLSHEFSHGLEDASAYSLNPLFQQIMRDEGEAYTKPYIRNNTLENMRSLGLICTFNTSSFTTENFFGKTMLSRYYSTDDDSLDTTDNENYQNYRLQFRERHAYRFEKFITGHLSLPLQHIKDAQKPSVDIFMQGQQMIFCFRSCYTDKIKPCIASETLADFEYMLDDVNHHFSKSHDRTNTYSNRLRDMHVSLYVAKDVIRIAYQGDAVHQKDKSHINDIYGNIHKLLKKIDLHLNVLKCMEPEFDFIVDRGLSPNPTPYKIQPK